MASGAQRDPRARHGQDPIPRPATGSAPGWSTRTSCRPTRWTRCRRPRLKMKPVPVHHRRGAGRTAQGVRRQGVQRPPRRGPDPAPAGLRGAGQRSLRADASTSSTSTRAWRSSRARAPRSGRSTSAPAPLARSIAMCAMRVPSPLGTPRCPVPDPTRRAVPDGARERVKIRGAAGRASIDAAAAPVPAHLRPRLPDGRRPGTRPEAAGRLVVGRDVGTLRGKLRPTLAPRQRRND